MWEKILSFQHTDRREGAPIIRLGDEHMDLLSHLPGTCWHSGIFNGGLGHHRSCIFPFITLSVLCDLSETPPSLPEVMRLCSSSETGFPPPDFRYFLHVEVVLFLSSSYYAIGLLTLQLHNSSLCSPSWVPPPDLSGSK